MSRRPPRADRGSVTPLVIGMVLCLLLLGCGVTAAGSAFLGQQRLRHLCDGAATVAADTGAVTGMSETGAAAAAAQYLAVRDTGVAAGATVTPDAVRLTCSGSITIAFGGLFGAPTIEATVVSMGRPTFTTE